MNLFQIIKRPVVSEKSQMLELEGTYVVEVDSNATKVDVRSAFERLYGVKVASVNVIKTREKFRTAGRRMAQMKRHPAKKALVTLAGSDRIADFQKIKTK